MHSESPNVGRDIESYLKETRRMNILQKIWKNPVTGLGSLILIPLFLLFGYFTSFQVNLVGVIVFSGIILYFFILGAAPLNFPIIVSNGLIRLDEFLKGFLTHILFGFVAFYFTIVCIVFLSDATDLLSFLNFLVPAIPYVILTFFMFFVAGVFLFLWGWDTIMPLVNYESRKGIADTIALYLPLLAMLIASFLDKTPIRSGFQTLLSQTNLYSMFTPIYYGLIMGVIYSFFVYYPFYKFSKAEKEKQLKSVKEKEQALENQLKESGSKRTYTKTVEIIAELRLLDVERQLIEKRKLHPHPRFLGLISILISSFIIEIIVQYILQI